MSADKRPMSPHLVSGGLGSPLHWRWHITMFTSILHRASIFAIYLGLLLLAGWAVTLAAGPESHADYMDILFSPLGLVVLFGITVMLFFNLAYNVRQAFWDMGHGFLPKTANTTAMICIVFGVVAALLTWIAAAALGAFQ